MRALLATAGLLVLTGSAAAGSPTAHTLRKSPGAPIEAIAQDGKTVAWLSSSTSQACNEVHVYSPGMPDRSLPQPASNTMTCGWDLTQGQSELAIAPRMSTALWTLHQSGPSPLDAVVAAPYGGPERQVERLAHASDGTGKWLDGVAGSGKTLAYSWADVEYVDKLACLSGGSCKRKIADGGIRVITGKSATPLPGAQPALQLAASAGRIAYIPATRVPANRPGASTNNSVYVVDAVTGDPVSSVYVHGVPAAIALSPQVLVVLTQRGPRDRISWFSATDGTKLGSVLVSSRAEPEIAASDQLIVYRVNRTLLGVSTATGAVRTLAKTGPNPVGLALKKNQLVWAENRGDGGRIRALAVPGS